MAAGNATIGALRVNLGIDSAQFSTGLKDAQDRLGKFGRAADVALAAVVAAGALAAASIAKAVKSVIDYADDMDKASQKFGVPVEDLSRLKYAADMAGVSFDTLGTGLRKLAQNMDDAATGGTSRAAQAFQTLGIAVENTDGTLRSQTEVLADLADKFGTMPDGAQKTAMAMAVLGKSGAELIPVLNGGAEGLREMMNEADELGLVISGKTAAAADAFNDNLDRLGKVWEGLATTLTARLLPYLQRLSEILLAFVRDKAKLDTVFDGIVAGVKWLVETAYLATVAIENFGKSISALGEIGSAFAKGDWLGVVDGFGNFGDVLDANKKRIEDATAAIKTMWDTTAMGLGKNFGTGWTAPANDNGGGGYDQPSQREQDDTDRLREQAERKLEILRESLRTEEESELASYMKRLEQLQEFQDARVLSEQEAADLRTKIEQEHQQKIKDIQDQRLSDLASSIGSVGSIISSLSTIMGKEGDKQLAITKALSIAEAIINTYVGITQALRDPTLIGPARFAAAAAVAAQGFAAVASIVSTSKGSSGKKSAGGGGGAAAAGSGAAGPAHSVYLQGVDPNRTYTGEQLRSLVEGLNKAHADGYVLKVAA